jgi:hypothetical protein
VLPALRSLIARELIEKHGFSQVVAAKKLGITQATISHYLYSKRGEKYLKQIEQMNDIKTMVNDIADEIANGDLSSLDIISRFCDFCSQLRTEHLLCNMHRDVTVLPDACNLCGKP